MAIYPYNYQDSNVTLEHGKEVSQDEIGFNGVLRVNSKFRKQTQLPEYLPTWNPNEKYGPSTFFKYEDPALKADPSFPHLFQSEKHGNLEIKKISPSLGSEVRGVQLSDLDVDGKNELALFVAERGVVVFRDQDFFTRGAEYVTKYAEQFGKLHMHPTSGAPEGASELHVVYRRPDGNEVQNTFKDRTTSVLFHTDISYVLQPPSYTIFGVVDGPESGGDTLFANSIGAFERLSPQFQEFLSGLHVIHSSKEQADHAKSLGGIQRREPVTHIHPLVRVHPVSKRKILYANRGFSRRIVELKKPESDLLLNFLYNLIETSRDLQIRANWEPGTVTVWDNRSVQHTAIIDWEEPVTRLAVRLTPQAERPVEDLRYLNDPEYYPSASTLDL